VYHCDQHTRLGYIRLLIPFTPVNCNDFLLLPSSPHLPKYELLCMMIPPKPPTTKKRASRAEARKVTSLSAERLERKRANDREAQRIIRQRTREHIERLEHQVAKLKAEREQFDDVVRRNVTLEHEIRALKHQLALASRQGYLGMIGWQILFLYYSYGKNLEWLTVVSYEEQKERIVILPSLCSPPRNSLSFWD
jgi:hypothetical protein